MISVAVWVLTVAVTAGTVLALWHLRAADEGARPPFVAGVAHGVAGAVGFVVLLLALRGPARGVGAGVGSFGTVAAVLFGGALLTGAALLLFRRKTVAIKTVAIKTVVMTIHAGIAITAYVLLLAWNSLG